MRSLIAVLTPAALVVIVACVGACSSASTRERPYGAQAARFGESLGVLGWNVTVSNLRWDVDRVLVDVSASVAAVSGAASPHAEPPTLRFGLYGALAHPLEATGIGSCETVMGLASKPLAAPTPDRLAGTVCLGPLKDRSAVRGVYVYSPRDRIAGSTAAYPAAFPVGMLPTNPNDTGLAVTSTSVAAWRADGTRLTQASLGDPTAFTGNGYLLLGLVVDAVAARYRDDSNARGGPMMLVAAPSAPDPRPGSPCAAYGSSVLVLPAASLGAVHVSASLCTQGEINEAVLYATVSVIGTHAAVWTQSG